MELRGDEGSVYHVHQRKDIWGKLEGSVWTTEREESNNKDTYRCKIIVKPEKLHYKS